MAKARFALALILLLLSLNFAVTAATATPVEVKWSQVSIPAEDEAGGWLLAGGSDVKHLSLATTGTLYAYADGLDLLLESTDGGAGWTKTGYNGGDVVDIATSSLDADVLYVTDGSMVYRSDDGGASFILVAGASLQAALTALGGAQVITTIAASYDASDNAIVFVGTDDTTADTCNGDVLFMIEGQYPLVWASLGLGLYGSYDVISIAASPGFATSKKIIALVTNDAPETLVISNEGVMGNWDTVAELLEGNTTSFGITAASDIGFPADYADTEILFVGVVGDTGGGDVYMVYGAAASSAAIDLNIGSGYGSSNIDVLSLAVSGNTWDAGLLAGAAGSAQVYRSSDGGASWEISVKEPSGQSQTSVVMSSDFSSSRKAYAATSGVESAVSRTSDGGATWNQVGLIDTAISNIVDLAVSPSHSQAGTLFMLTWGGEFSLWRSLMDGAGWERVFSSAPASVSSIDMVGLSPQYGNGSQVLFIAGSGDGNPAIWKSADNGQSFSRRSAPLPVYQWAVAGDATLFVAGYDGSNGLVYRTNNSGLSYSSGVVAGSQSLSSIALSPDYDRDGTILVGNSNGWVYWSNDNGTSFEPLPPGAILPPISGNISVAFAPRFSSNRTVYAASETPSAGIYRFVIGTSTGWQSIDSTLPAGGMIRGLVVSADGTLYAANFQQVDTVNGKGGVERCLEPASSPGTTFETVTRGLSDGTTLWGLWLNGNQLWSIDTTNNRLMTYIDSLSRSVVLSSPNDGVGLDTTTTATLDWAAMAGATAYEIGGDITEAGISATSKAVAGLTAGTSYDWKVRATAPYLSRWSETWEFTTAMEAVEYDVFWVPEPGAQDVSVDIAFAWPSVDGAVSYELEVADNVAFVGASPATSTTDSVACPITLEYSTTYYWRVKVIGADSESDWSLVGAFTTMAEPEPPIVVEPQPTPTITFEIPEITWPEIVLPDIILPEIVLPDIILPEIVLQDIILPTPQVTVDLTALITIVIEAQVLNVEEVAPAYIWAIVVIGGVLVIAVIVLIVRTGRIV